MGSMVAGPHSNRRPRRPLLVHLTLLFLLVLPLVLANAASALAIGRSTVLSRAQRWIDSPVPYSQSRYFNGYRQDCSGYASMSWQTGSSYNTASMYRVTCYITKDELRPGDGLNRPKVWEPYRGGHIRLFMGWLDDSHNLYVAYEQTGPNTKTTIQSYQMDRASGYRPVRYDHITESTPSRSLLLNGTFNTWAHIWPRSRFTDPVWWKVTASNENTAAIRRQDVYRKGGNSAQFVNPSAHDKDIVEMSQVVTITPDTSYTASAWARTANDPSGVQMVLEYLNVAGESVARTTVGGGTAGLNDAGFRVLTTTRLAPVDGVRARVTLRLAGGSTQVGTMTVPGTSVLLDDVSLYRPYVTSTIAASTTSARIGGSVKLSGSLSRAAAVGNVVTVYVQPPGGGWVKYHNHVVKGSASGAVWNCGGYAFRRGMRTGTYDFKVVVPGHNGYLGSTSGVVSVRVR